MKRQDWDHENRTIYCVRTALGSNEQVRWFASKKDALAAAQELGSRATVEAVTI